MKRYDWNWIDYEDGEIIEDKEGDYYRIDETDATINEALDYLARQLVDSDHEHVVAGVAEILVGKGK